MPRILVVDDDPHIREIVCFALEKAGHEVASVASGEDALARLEREGADAIVLDVVLPEMDGLDVIRELRAHSEVPVLFLSSRDDEVDRILGLELGGDDYLTKPFSPRELVARVKALLRRNRVAAETPSAGDVVERGALRLDRSAYRCHWEGSEVALTSTEFGLLSSLLGSAGRVYTRAELVERAWDHGHHFTDRTIDSHIRRVRRKFAELGADPIETVYGVGYRLRA
jgi:two-component system OmpR family response regulator